MTFRPLPGLLMMLAVPGCQDLDDSEGYFGSPNSYVSELKVEEANLEGTFIIVGNVSLDLYDGSGRIIVEDRRISSQSFGGIYVRVSSNDPDYTGFFDIPMALRPSVLEGKLILSDPNHLLITWLSHIRGSISAEIAGNDGGVTFKALENAEFVLVVLVSDQASSNST